MYLFKIIFMLVMGMQTFVGFCDAVEESMYDRQKREGGLNQTRNVLEYKKHHAEKLKEVQQFKKTQLEAKETPKEEHKCCGEGCQCEEGCSCKPPKGS